MLSILSQFSTSWSTKQHMTVWVLLWAGEQIADKRHDFCCREALSLVAFDLVSIQMSTFREILLDHNILKSLSFPWCHSCFLCPTAHTPYQKALVYLLVYCLIPLPKNKTPRRARSLNIFLTSVSLVPGTMILCNVYSSICWRNKRMNMLTCLFLKYLNK